MLWTSWTSGHRVEADQTGSEEWFQTRGAALLYRWPSGKEDGEDEACWSWRRRQAVTAPPCCRLSHRAQGLAGSDFQCFASHFLAPSSSSFSCSLHDFRSLLHSACRHTLTCCMSPCGNPACHIIYLFNRKRLNHLMSRLDISRCIYWIGSYLKRQASFRRGGVALALWPGAKHGD